MRNPHYRRDLFVDVGLFVSGWQVSITHTLASIPRRLTSFRLLFFKYLQMWRFGNKSATPAPSERPTPSQTAVSIAEG
jgi:hypothetical protein